MGGSPSRNRHERPGGATDPLQDRDGRGSRRQERPIRRVEGVRLGARVSDGPGRRQLISRYQSWDPPFTLAQAQDFVGALATTNPDTPGRWFQFAVVETSSGAHIGDLAALVDEADPRLARIGFTLARSAQGNGYATEATTGLLDYLFVARRKHRVAADCDIRNAPSIAVLERLGMRREGHHRESAWWKGEWTDELVYATLVEEWTIRSRVARL